ncbi:MAG: TetR/AcrR family transcriptional regulator [Polyangiaceae bacterium]|nr:TetR/AcrR family transcriptional regulator [Polyangiaceae bacterium]
MASGRKREAQRGVAETVTDGRRARTLETRGRIRAAAWELFSTQGYEATTTQAIAKRAGVAAGTVFVHASDKADLLFLVMDERLSAVVEARMAAVPPGPLLSRLLFVFAGILETYGESPGVAAAFVKNLPGATGPNAQRMTSTTFAFIYRLGLLVEEAQATGEVSKDVQPMACAQNIFGLYFMSLMAWLSGHASLEFVLDPLLKDSLALQIRGFRP